MQDPNLRPTSTNRPMYGYCDYKHLNAGAAYKLLTRQVSKELKLLLKELSVLPSGSTVLNLGCGDGNLELNAGSARHYSLVSIDIEEPAIRSTQDVFYHQNRNSKDKVLLGDITDLSSIEQISGEKFDAIIMWRVLHGINPDKYDQLFTQLYKALTPKGKLYIAVASTDDWKASKLGDYDKEGMNDCSGVMFRDYGVPRETPFMVHFFSETELIGMGEKHGFASTSHISFEEPSGYPHLIQKKNSYILSTFVR